MRYVIWGAGDRGRRIFFHLQKYNVQAFIDTDKKKIGKNFCNTQVISFNEYKLLYTNSVIVISTHEEEVVPILKNAGITHYFLLSECPEDFQHPNARNILRDNVKKRINPQNRYLIYGCSLLSLLVLEWIKELDTLYKPYFYMGKVQSEVIYDELLKDNGVIAWTSGTEVVFDEVLVTIEEGCESQESILYRKLCNLFRYSEKIPMYRNDNIEQYRGIHHNKRCFVIGHGPSLRMEDLNTLYLHNEFTFSLNEVYKFKDRSLWRPSFYVAGDPRAVEDGNFQELIRYLEHIPSFISDANSTFAQKEKPDHIQIYHEAQLWVRDGYVPFSEDCSQIVYNCGSVIYDIFQFAVYMGFRTIYLLGVDATGINNEYSVIQHAYYEKTLSAICYGGQVRTGYLSARKYANEHDVKILNATRGGELEIFERVAFDSLFDE